MIIGLIEHDRGKLNDLSLQMLTLGRRLADQSGVPLHAVLIGEVARPLANGLGAYGVSVAHLALHERLDDYAPEAWAQCVVELMGAVTPEAVLAAGTDRSHEVMAHVPALGRQPVGRGTVDGGGEAADRGPACHRGGRSIGAGSARRQRILPSALRQRF